MSELCGADFGLGETNTAMLKPSGSIVPFVLDNENQLQGVAALALRAGYTAEPVRCKSFYSRF